MSHHPKPLALVLARRLAAGGPTLVALQNIAALSHAARLVAANSPVRWTFEPGTPASIVDYLAGGAQGALEGAAIGLSLELLLTLLIPGATFGYLLAGGALLGAAGGAMRVEQGWRIRVVFAADGRRMLEATKVS
jgi:hypothetical protein